MTDIVGDQEPKNKVTLPPCVQAVFLAGVQLVTVDERVPGPARERILVSYYRYSGQAGHNSHVDTVCELLR